MVTQKHTSPSNLSGLTSDQAEGLLNKHGFNEIDVKISAHSHLFHPFLIIQIVAVIIVMLQHIVFGGIILVLWFVNLYFTRSSLKQLPQLLPPSAAILRNSLKRVLPARKVVPGDIIFVEQHGVVPADCTILKASHLLVDQSLFTHNVVSVEKHAQPHTDKTPFLFDNKNLLFAGSKLTHGNAECLVTATGMSTQLGKIVQPLLQHNERMLSYKPFVWGFGAVAVISAISLSVASSPQFMWQTLSLVALFGIPWMLIPLQYHQVSRFLRSPAKIEDFAQTSAVVFDSSVLQGKEELSWAYADKRLIEVSQDNIQAKGIQQIFTLGVLTEDEAPFQSSVRERAEASGINPEKTFEVYEKTAKIPFTTQRGFATKLFTTKGKKIAVAYGEPLALLEKCETISAKVGTERLTRDHKRELEDAVLSMKRKGYVARGYAVQHYVSSQATPDEIESEMLFAGLLFFGRPLVLTSGMIKDLLADRIRVYLLSSSSKEETQHVAKNIGLGNYDIAESLFVKQTPLDKIETIKKLVARHANLVYVGNSLSSLSAMVCARAGVCLRTTKSEIRGWCDAAIDHIHDFFGFLKWSREISHQQKTMNSYLLTLMTTYLCFIVVSALLTQTLPLTLFLGFIVGIHLTLCAGMIQKTTQSELTFLGTVALVVTGGVYYLGLASSLEYARALSFLSMSLFLPASLLSFSKQPILPPHRGWVVYLTLAPLLIQFIVGPTLALMEYVILLAIAAATFLLLRFMRRVSQTDDSSW